MTLGLAALKGSSVGIRSSQRWCESFSWSEKSRRTIMRISDAGEESAAPSVSVARADFDFAFDEDFALELPLDFLEEVSTEAACFSSSSLRSILSWSFLSSRNPCFQPSRRCRACWAASSSPPKSKTKNEYAMVMNIGGPGLRCQDLGALFCAGCDSTR